MWQFPAKTPSCVAKFGNLSQSIWQGSRWIFRKNNYLASIFWAGQVTDTFYEIRQTRWQDAIIAGIIKAWQFKLTSAMFPRKSATN
jgi:hypothetical protein